MLEATRGIRVAGGRIRLGAFLCPESSDEKSPESEFYRALL